MHKDSVVDASLARATSQSNGRDALLHDREPLRKVNPEVRLTLVVALVLSLPQEHHGRQLVCRLAHEHLALRLHRDFFESLALRRQDEVAVRTTLLAVLASALLVIIVVIVCGSFKHGKEF